MNDVLQTIIIISLSTLLFIMILFMIIMKDEIADYREHKKYLKNHHVFYAKVRYKDFRKFLYNTVYKPSNKIVVNGEICDDNDIYTIRDLNDTFICEINFTHKTICVGVNYADTFNNGSLPFSRKIINGKLYLNIRGIFNYFKCDLLLYCFKSDFRNNTIAEEYNKLNYHEREIGKKR